MSIRNYLIIILSLSIFIIINKTIHAKLTANTVISYVFVTKWGSEGYSDGQFKEPLGIAVDLESHIYIADTGNNRIQKFNSNGNFITKWISKDYSNGQFIKPVSLAVDNNKNVYVGDYEYPYIQKFNSDGKFLTRWNIFSHLVDIFIDFNGDVYTISYPYWLVKYNSEGTIINSKYYTFKGDGCQEIESIVIDLSGHIYLICSNWYVSSPFSNPIKPDASINKLDKSFNFITKWGNEGKENQYFKDYIYNNACIYSIAKLAIDINENIYVLECANSCIQKFDSNGNFITKFGSKGSGDGEFLAPTDITVDKEGNVYVVDSGNCRIQKFAPNPEYKQNK